MLACRDMVGHGNERRGEVNITHTCPESTPWLKGRADRLSRLVDRLYAKGHTEIAFPLAREWHRIASILAERGHNIYRA